MKQSRIGTGSVQFITITDGGAGYTTTPTVTFSNPLLDNVFCDSDQITCDSDQNSQWMTQTSLGKRSSKSFECH